MWRKLLHFEIKPRLILQTAGINFVKCSLQLFDENSRNFDNFSSRET